MQLRSRYMSIAGACILMVSSVKEVSCLMSQTAGTPLGGLGSGGVKFHASRGTFAISELGAPLLEHDFYSLEQTRFQLFVKQTDEVTTADPLKSPNDDDATFPYHRVNFGNYNAVSVAMTGYSPLRFDQFEEMAVPCALYEFTVENQGSSAADVAIALQLETPQTPRALTNGKGFYSEGKGRAAMAASSDAGAQITIGSSDDDFFSNGVCSNEVSGTLNRTAVKVSLNPGGKEHLRFVLSWFWPHDCNLERDVQYYTNEFGHAGEVADKVIGDFDLYKDEVENFVERVQGSNVPEWFTSTLLVTLSTLATNSMMLKDGRWELTEGDWYVDVGTLDQTWHSDQIFAMLMPRMQWESIKWWAGTQRNDGQILHDFGKPGSGCPDLQGWNHNTSGRYHGWFDHPAGFVIQVYESFISTGDRAMLDALWPKVKKSAEKMVAFFDEYGQSSQYPYTFERAPGSTYDWDNSDNRIYNSALASIAFKLFARLADYKGEHAMRDEYDAMGETSIQSFEQRWLTSNPPGHENTLVGQWLANVFKLNSGYSKDNLDRALDAAAQANQTFGVGATDRIWGIYQVLHAGGIFLQTGRYEEWRKLQHSLFSKLAELNPYAYSLHRGVDGPRDGITSKPNYCSISSCWRTYYDLVGFHRNKVTGELWLEPMIPPEMEGELSNAAFFCPETWGTIDCSEEDSLRVITFTPDKPISVSNMYVKDGFGSGLRVFVDGIQHQVERIGEGYLKRVRIAWDRTVEPTGTTIIMTDDPQYAVAAGYAMPKYSEVHSQQENMTTRAWSVYSLRGQRISVNRRDRGHYGMPASIPNGIYIRHRNGGKLNCVLQHEGAPGKSAE